MLHMQPPQKIALLLTQPIAAPQIEFPTAQNRAHQLQLERVRDSLLRRPEARHGHGDRSRREA
jgi:hypothetical protein